MTEYKREIAGLGGSRSVEGGIRRESNSMYKSYSPQYIGRFTIVASDLRRIARADLAPSLSVWGLFDLESIGTPLAQH